MLLVCCDVLSQNSRPPSGLLYGGKFFMYKDKKSGWLMQMRRWETEVTATKKDTLRTVCAQIKVTGKP